jgi:hypothetical protein
MRNRRLAGHLRGHKDPRDCNDSADTSADAEGDCRVGRLEERSAEERADEERGDRGDLMIPRAHAPAGEQIRVAHKLAPDRGENDCSKESR